MNILLEVSLQKGPGKNFHSNDVARALADAIEDLGSIWIDDTNYEIRWAGVR